MPIPPEIEALIEQINRDLNEIERDANQGIENAQRLLRQFPDNPYLTRSFAVLGNHLFWVESIRRQIEFTLETLNAPNAPDEIIRECGEFLASLQGRVYEARTVVNQIKTQLENRL